MLLPTSSPERCGGCGGYFGSSAAARVWCVYINFKRSKKTAPAAPALADQQSFAPPLTPADPEPFTLNRETGAKGEVSRSQGTGYGLRGKGAVVVVLRRRCFFSELRVITLKREKYSILKTTTTTDYLHQSLKPQQAEAAVALEEAAINFFLRHTFIYCTHMRKNRTPPVACWEN